MTKHEEHPVFWLKCIIYLGRKPDHCLSVIVHEHPWFRSQKLIESVDKKIPSVNVCQFVFFYKLYLQDKWKLTNRVFVISRWYDSILLTTKVFLKLSWSALLSCLNVSSSRAVRLTFSWRIGVGTSQLCIFRRTPPATTLLWIIRWPNWTVKVMQLLFVWISPKMA